METLTFRLRRGYADSGLGIELPITISSGPGRSVSILAKVDTGAACCIFQREYAEELGIDVEKGQQTKFRTATGSFETYGHQVALSCFEWDFEAVVYFAQAHEFSRNVLGLQGWLDKLRFGLVHHDQSLFLSHYDDIS